MFNKIKEIYHSKKNLDNLADLILYSENNNDIINNVFLKKVYIKYPKLKETFDEHNINEYIKNLNKFFINEKEVSIFKSYIKLNKNLIETFIENNFDQIDNKLYSVHFRFLNFSILNNFYETSNVTFKMYNMLLNNILNSNKDNYYKIQEVYLLFKDISYHGIVKNIFNKELRNLIDDVKKDILNKEINLEDITFFKNLNSYLYSKNFFNNLNNHFYNKNLYSQNEFIEKVNIIEFYNKIEFSKIKKNSYLELLKNKDVDLKLFDNIINNIEVNKNNVEDILNSLKTSKYKENYTDLINVLDKQVVEIKRNRDKNILLGTLLIGALASSSNNSNNNSLFDDIVNIGVDVGIGYGIGEIIDTLDR